MTLFDTSWVFSFGGSLHPLLVHFPIGLLIGAFILESISLFKGKGYAYESVVYLGALFALLAAVAGQLLLMSDSYEGVLVQRHQWLGWLTASLSLITAFCYFIRERLPNLIPCSALLVTVVATAIAGHLGASITHGEDYISYGFKRAQNQLNTTAMMGQDSLTADQLDELNLEVRAIFAHNCYQCHSTAKRKGGLALDHKEGVFAGGDYGPVITIGSSEESEMIRRLRLSRSDEDAMPPEGKVLSDEEINLISFWIDKGTPWADVGLKVFREAPLALEKPLIPQGPNHFSHPIDRFVDDYFDTNGIKWTNPIEDHRFIRRAYLDIIGLLPSPEDVERFEQNQNKNKRSQLIDELLKDEDNYTIHWLSFWNDLLRNDYSGTGFITGGRKQITNWLFQSLKTGKPYNQMVSELISPNEESEGFIKGIQWRGVVNASQRTELQAAQNISQSLLGLNLKCASCHNSFVNNLTLDQAYGFANVFAKDPLEIFRCDKPTGRIANTSFIYPELGEVMADSLVDRLRQLADVIVRPENGRLYRTIVNRFWDRLFGRGIVTPVDEMDKLPWSQGLLDWLAMDFIENGYDMRHLLKTIMTSKAYQLPAVSYNSPNRIASESFVFKGPVTRRLSAEQFTDAVSQSVNPLYYGMAFLPDNQEIGAEWIWYEDIELDRRSLPRPGKRYFRKVFKTDGTKQVRAADVLITADHSFEFYFNGTEVGTGADWRRTHTFSIDAQDIQNQNIIAVTGTNEGNLANPAGLLFALRLTYDDESKQFILSDRSWSTTNVEPGQKWAVIDYDENNWEKVYSQGPLGAWGILADFTFDDRPKNERFARSALVKLDPLMKTLGRPTRENVATTREGNVTLLQAMTLANNDFLYSALQKGVQKWLENSSPDRAGEIVESLYMTALSRKPSRKESRLISEHIQEDFTAENIVDLVWSVFLLPEFQFI